MTPVRRIAAAALVAALGLGFVGIGAGPANAGDTTWGYKIKDGSSQSIDTTWGYKKNFR
jgi:ABC-type dipeptide/oligopeptide/nickel transport system permease subunit